MPTKLSSTFDAAERRERAAMQRDQTATAGRVLNYDVEIAPTSPLPQAPSSDPDGQYASQTTYHNDFTVPEVPHSLSTRATAPPRDLFSLSIEPTLEKQVTEQRDKFHPPRSDAAKPDFYSIFPLGKRPPLVYRPPAAPAPAPAPAPATAPTMSRHHTHRHAPFAIDDPSAQGEGGSVDGGDEDGDMDCTAPHAGAGLGSTRPRQKAAARTVSKGLGNMRAHELAAYHDARQMRENARLAAEVAAQEAKAREQSAAAWEAAAALREQRDRNAEREAALLQTSTDQRGPSPGGSGVSYARAMAAARRVVLDSLPQPYAGSTAPPQPAPTPAEIDRMAAELIEKRGAGEVIATAARGRTGRAVVPGRSIGVEVAVDEDDPDMLPALPPARGRGRGLYCNGTAGAVADVAVDTRSGWAGLSGRGITQDPNMRGPKPAKRAFGQMQRGILEEWSGLKGRTRARPRR